MTIKSTIDVEDFNENPDTRPGQNIKDGFQDPSGANPKLSYINTPDVNIRTRGDVNEQIINSGTLKPRTTSTSNQVKRGVVSEPNIPIQSKYPYNKTFETRSGHLIELDDTPGHERIFIKHRSGTKTEFRPDGSMKFIGTKNRYQAIAGDDDLIIRGNVNVIIESNADIRVQGDMNCQVDGDYNLLVQGNKNIEIQGDLNERVHGDTIRTFTGTYLREIRGNIIERNLSNYNCWNVGKWTSNIGAAVSLTTESTLEILSDDTLTMECEGGFIDLKLPASNIITGTSYAVDFHAEDNFYGDEIHVTTGFSTTWNGALEGTAKKSTYAVTAGAAPTGSAVTTTPSPTGPTSATASPDSTLEAVDVASTSDNFIKVIDRSVVNNDYNTRKLNTYEVMSRMRNSNLRYDSKWLQDQVNTGAINQAATSSSAKNAVRTLKTINNNKIGNSLTKIGNFFLKNNSFKLSRTNNLKIKSIPKEFELTEAKRETRISPNFTVANFLAGDSCGAQLIDQGGLTKLQIAQNLQLLSYNVVEFFRDKFKDNWSISEGVYNLLPNEKLNSDSINLKFLQGLAIGIQFADHPKSFYYDAAVWASNNLTFDKIILSYIDYDPDDINEPTLIISINNGNNSKTIQTEFNNEIIASELQDLSND